MPRSRTQSLLTGRLDAQGSHRTPDELIVEEPLEIRLDGTLISSTMRTPGHDFELAAGFCLAEGVLGDATILGIRYCATGSAVDTEFNVVTVQTGGKAPEPTPRLGSTSSSCGICGSEAILELVERLNPLPAIEPWSLEFLRSLPDRVLPHQELFAATGASHAAAAFSRSGEMLVVREDIGRHNAVDKVVGHLLLDAKLLDVAVADGEDQTRDIALFVSGRASFEMVQKAWAAGFTALVAVSGASGLAASTARRAGLTMIGFARSETATLYSPAA